MNIGGFGEKTPNEVAELIKKTYKYQEVTGERVTVILLGPPGVGKTVTVRKVAETIARESGRKFMELGTEDVENIDVENSFLFLAFSILHADPVDFMGIPRPGNGNNSVKYYLPDILDVLTKKGAKGIVLIDEFTLDSREDRRAALLKLVDEGYLGYRKISSGVLIVLAGNTTKWSDAANTLDEPMRRGRAIIVFVKPPSVEAWIEWMNRNYQNWDRRIGAFLLLYPQEFFTSKDEDDDGYTAINSPRNWTRLSLLMNGGDSMEYIDGLVRARTAVLLKTFLSTAVPSAKEIAKKPETWKTLSREAKYILLSQIAGVEGEHDVFSELYQVMAEQDKESLILLLTMMGEGARTRFVIYAQKHMPTVFSALKEIRAKMRIAEEDED
ncbi:MAG: ATP-binding protein [Desulfurococcaceae archaeon]